MSKKGKNCKQSAAAQELKRILQTADKDAEALQLIYEYLVTTEQVLDRTKQICAKAEDQVAELEEETCVAIMERAQAYVNEEDEVSATNVRDVLLAVLPDKYARDIRNIKKSKKNNKDMDIEKIAMEFAKNGHVQNVHFNDIHDNQNVYVGVDPEQQRRNDKPEVNADDVVKSVLENVLTTGVMKHKNDWQVVGYMLIDFMKWDNSASLVYEKLESMGFASPLYHPALSKDSLLKDFDYKSYQTLQAHSKRGSVDMAKYRIAEQIEKELRNSGLK